MRGLNPRPCAHKTHTLPTELTDHSGAEAPYIGGLGKEAPYIGGLGKEAPYIGGSGAEAPEVHRAGFEPAKLTHGILSAAPLTKLGYRCRNIVRLTQRLCLITFAAYYTMVGTL